MALMPYPRAYTPVASPILDQLSELDLVLVPFYAFFFYYGRSVHMTYLSPLY